MSQDEGFPVLRAGDVVKAFPDLRSGDVIKVHPDDLTDVREGELIVLQPAVDEDQVLVKDLNASRAGSDEVGARVSTVDTKAVTIQIISAVGDGPAP